MSNGEGGMDRLAADPCLMLLWLCCADSNVMDTRTTDNDAMHFPENVMSTVDNLLFEP